AGEYALAPVQVPYLLLSRVAAVQNRKRPPVKTGAALDLQTLDREIGLGKPEARGDVVDRIWRICEPRHVIRPALIEAAGKARIGQVGDRIRVDAEQLVGLSKQH